MRILAFFVLVIVALLSACGAPVSSISNTVTTQQTAPSESPSPDTELQKQIAEIAKEANGKVGVYAVEIETGKTAALNENEHFAMQSVVKVPISMAVLKMVDEVKLQLDQLVNVDENDMATANQRSPIRDRAPKGTQMFLEELIKDAIVESDGTASDVLQRVVGGASKVQSFVESIGVSDVKIIWSHREFGAAWSRQYDNWLTPRSATVLLQKLWSFSLNAKTASDTSGISKQSADLLLRFMSASKNPKDRILGMLPEGTVVAHKTGTGGVQDGITSATNDIAIITLPNGNHIAIAVLVGDSSGNAKQRADTIAKIAKAVFDKWSGAQKTESVKSANFNERHTLN